MILKYTDSDRSFMEQNEKENCPEKVTQHLTPDAINYEGMGENNNIKAKNYYLHLFYHFYIYAVPLKK
jgi:hypothetical protein